MTVDNIQLNNYPSASLSVQDMLSLLEENGIIDADSAIDIMTKAKRKEILSKHLCKALHK